MSNPDLDTSPTPEPLDGVGALHAEAVSRFGRNASGRDFVVGDIHGMFGHVERLLERVDFAPEHDRLFSVGDLVDRGPRSKEAVSWLAKPWFHACRGNHEQFALDSDDPEQRELWIAYNGGAWWLELGEHERRAHQRAFRAMPLAMEIDTEGGRIGIVHADIHPSHTWEEFLSALEAGDEEALFFAIWSRMRVTGETTAPVSGEVVRVYCGHTPTRETVLIGNVFYLDTGAVYCHEGYQDARLSMVQVHPGEPAEFEIRTFEP